MRVLLVVHTWVSSYLRLQLHEQRQELLSAVPEETFRRLQFSAVEHQISNEKLSPLDAHPRVVQASQVLLLYDYDLGFLDQYL